MRTVRRFVLGAVLCLAATGMWGQVPGEGWTRLGLLGGRVTAVGVSPNYNSDKTVFVGLYQAGLWRSVDRGVTWSHLTSVPDDCTVTGVAFDYSGSTDYVHIGTQEGHVYTSSSGFSTLLYDYTAPSSSPVTSVLCPSAGLLVAGTQGQGIFLNPVHGSPAYFAQIAGAAQMDCRALAANASGSIFAAVVEPAQYTSGPVYLYTVGAGWLPRGPSSLTGQVPLSLAIARNSTGSDVAWLGMTGNGIWRNSSVTSSTTWSRVCSDTVPLTTQDADAVAACPRFQSDNEVWGGFASGLWISMNAGGACGAFFPFAAVTAIGFSPGYHTGGLCDAFVGTQAGLYVKTCDGVSAVPYDTPPIEPDGTPASVPVDALAIGRYAFPGAWAGSPAVGLLRNSRNLVFLQYNEHAAFGEAKPDVVAVRVAPVFDSAGACGTDQQTVVVAERTRGIFRSEDDGNSWSQLGSFPAGVRINDMVLSPAYATGTPDETIYAATTKGLFRWDGTSWTITFSDFPYNVTHVALPPTYRKSSSSQGAPYHFVAISTQDSRLTNGGGLYISGNDGASISRVTTFAYPDVSAVTFSPKYGLADWLLFASRAGGGPWVSGSVQNPLNTSAIFCAMTSGVSAYMRDLEASPQYGSGTLALVAATDLGPYYCLYDLGSDPTKCSLNYKWAPSGLPSGLVCKDALVATFAVRGDGAIAAAGMAEDGVLASKDGGQTFRYRGSGYYSLPADVWTVLPYMRPDPTSGTVDVLFATSPTYGVFISEDRGASFHPWNGPGCTPLDDGAKGVGGGLGRYASTWTYDFLYAGPTTDCAGLWYRPIPAVDSGGSIVYPAYLDFLPWYQSNQATGAFQKIVNLSNGNPAETVWASSTTDGACTGLGEYILPAGAYDGWMQQNTGLGGTDATSVRYGQDTSGNPAPLTAGVSVNGSVSYGQWASYYIVVPDGSVHLSVVLDNLTQDVDLYVRYQAQPTLSAWDYRPYFGGTTPETVDVYPTSSPRPLTSGIWYVSVYGYSSGTTTFRLTASLPATLGPAPEAYAGWVKAEPSRLGTAPREEGPQDGAIPPPSAPISSTTWGTVNRTGVYKGTQTSTLAPVPEVLTWTWEARNGAGTTALDTSKDTQTVLQLGDGTLVAGQAGALWQSPAPDEGRTTWYDVQATLGGQGLPADPDVRDFLETDNCGAGVCDLLVAVNGAAGRGGVWLSGDEGVDWMNISSGFDATSQHLESVVHGSPLYYAGTDATGLYARTITPQPYPTVTGLSAPDGPASGGTTVTVTGTGFQASCPTGVASDCPFASPQVLFGSQRVAATWKSKTELQVTTQPHGAGAFTVKVLNPDTRLSNGSLLTFIFTGDTNLTLMLSRVSGKTQASWTSGGSPVDTQITVQRSTDPKFGSGVCAYTASGTSWTDPSGASTDGTLYFYRIQ